MAQERLWNGHKQGLKTVKKEVWGVRSKAQTERRTQWDGSREELGPHDPGTGVWHSMGGRWQQLWSQSLAIRAQNREAESTLTRLQKAARKWFSGSTAIPGNQVLSGRRHFRSTNIVCYPPPLSETGLGIVAHRTKTIANSNMCQLPFLHLLNNNNNNKS